MNKSLGEIALAREELIRSISRAAGKQLKVLLEEKHIYQHVVIDARSLIAAWGAKVRGMSSGIVIDDAEFDKERFSLADRQLSLAERGGPPDGSPILTLIIENPKLFCATCGGREVFRPVWYQDVMNELSKPHRFDGPIGNITPDGFQLFYITLQCQRCLGKPASVIVRRDEWRLSLHGRSPMEFVDVPKHIPKDERGHFRDAVIAVHGGKTLAGLFYLRTFIEQFARRATGETGRRYGDDLMEEYYKKLPANQRDMMPSLKEWYGKLSEPIHTGKPDEQLFEQAREAIEQHFDMRRVFRIPE